MKPRTALVLIAAGVAVAAAAYKMAPVFRAGGGHATAAPRSGGDGKGGGGPAAPVVTVAAATRDFPIRRKTIGIMESPAIVVIRSRIDSVLLEQHVADGQTVKKGDLLFTLDDREIQATIARDQATLAKDNATLAQAESEMKRKQELASKDVAPRQQVEQATAEFKAAQQTVEADRAVLEADRLRLGYAKLEAPITGRIGAVRVTPGNLVGANDPAGLATVTQMQPLRVAFSLPERDLDMLRKAAGGANPAVVRVYVANTKTELEAGRLDFVDSSVDTASGTIAAKASFANDKLELWPGMYVDVAIDLDVRPNSVIIPAVAIQSSQQGPFVFVAKADGTAEMRKIELVGIEENDAAVSTGVAEGDRVIVEGQMRLANGARIAEQAGGGAPANPAPPKAPAKP